MTYLVNKTDGTLLATVFDGQVDSPSSPSGHSSITLIGKQVNNYGELQNENFVHILENFSNNVDPVFPLKGQLWWNSSTNVMNVYDGTAWYPVTGLTNASSAPVSPRIGDQWWDTTNDQFKIYNGTTWLVIGPAYSKLDSKSGALVENVYDTSLGKHTVIKLFHNGSVTAIISRDAEFTPNVTIGGFTTVRPGISFTSAVDAIKFYGTATNADTFGNLTTTQFVRSELDSTLNVNFNILKQSNIGANGELGFSVSSGVATIKNKSNNKNLYIQANVAGTQVNAIAIDGTTGLVTVIGNPSSSNGVATKSYIDAELSSLSSAMSGFVTANASTITGYITSNVSAISGQISTINSTLLLKAPIDSPSFTGTPLSITPTQGDSSTQIATTNFVSTAIAAVTNASSGVFTSLQSQIDTINAANLPLKAPIDSPSFTGTPLSITPTQGDSSTKIATTAFVASAVSGLDATKIYNGTTFVAANNNTVGITISGSSIVTVQSDGIYVATASPNTNSTRVATTAYVDTATKNFLFNSVPYKPSVDVTRDAPNNAIGNDGDIWLQFQ